MLHKGNIHNHKKTPGMFRHSLSNFLQYGTNNRNNNADSLLGGVDFSGARVHAWPNHSIKIGSISGAVFAGSVATLLADGSNDNSSTITMQDLAVALVLAHFGSDPAFSLDPWEPTNPDGPWLRCVYYPEHSDDRQDIPMHKRLPFSFSQTAYGRTMFEADWLLKQLSMGVNLDQQNAAGPFPSPLPVRTFPAALLNLGLCDRFGLENRQTSPNSDNSPRYTRLWIIVDQEQTQEGVVAAHETCPIPIVSYSEQNDMGSSIAFRFSDVKLSVQVMRMTRGTTGQLEDLSDPRLVEPTCSEVVFARLMSTHYDEVARHYPALRRLKELAKLQAVAKWMIENDVEVDLSAALTHIQETSLTALEKVPALERKNSNARIYGGVNLSVRQGYHDRASPCCTLEKNAQIELKNMIRTSMITMASNNSFDLRTSVTTTTSPMVIPLPFIKKKQCCVCARPLDFTSLFKPSSASSDAAFCDEHHPDACFGLPISTELKSDCCRYHPACFMCAAAAAAAVAAAMAVSNTSSTSSTSEPHASTPIHHTATKTEWMEAIEQQRLERSTLNRLIINYLVTEGFKEAAEKFAEEAGISLSNVDLTSLDERLRIREAIESGRIQEAINLINTKAPELLDQNRQLAFHLKQQHLIELIRSNLIDEALTYAQIHLAEFAEEEIKMRQELEKTMALLVFDKPLESPYGYLMQISHRQQVANEINSALLIYQNDESESDLSMLVRMATYMQEKLDNKQLRYPKLVDIASGKLDDS
ncbi:unnamed protein product [Adineta steineri]|uniref:CTLH domain-containing protein n=1 Tax=Adineta steineri TaxID=433720 RepID=A0A819HF50_9BILA|nr:unnamed protein product [Adineta steineri]